MSNGGYAPVVTIGTSVLPRRADRRRWWGLPSRRAGNSSRAAGGASEPLELVPEPVFTRLSATEQLLSWTRQDLERVRTAIRQLAGERTAPVPDAHSTCHQELAALRSEVEALRRALGPVLLERRSA